MSHHPDDRQAEHWVAMLRDGSPAEKAAARRGLARHFEAQGLLAEATDLLLANARAGYRDVETFQALARLYRAQGNEYLAASAALEATRLSRPRAATTGPALAPRQAPWAANENEPAPTAEPRSAGQATGPAAGTAGIFDFAPSWQRPARILGWLAVVATLFAATMVASSSPWSSILYVISAASLGLLLSGDLTFRRMLRLPDGPLGDGALLFGWLLLLLVAGATVPRTGDVFVNPSSTTPIPTQSIYRTPAPSPTPSPIP